MKKIIAVLTLAFSLSTFCFAKEGKSLGISAGIKGGAIANIGTTLAVEVPSSAAKNIMFGGMAGAFVHVPILKNVGPGRFAVQPEVNVVFNNGVDATFDDGTESGFVKINSTTLDIAALIFYDIEIKKVKGLVIKPFIGPQISVPTYLYSNEKSTDVNGGFSTSKRSYTAKTLTYGVTAGCEFGYALGPGTILLDVRYFMDFNNTVGYIENTSYDLFKRSALAVNVGYEFKF